MYAANNFLIYRIVRRWIAKTLIYTGIARWRLSDRKIAFLEYLSENGEQKVIDHSIKDGDIVLDVGGYLGYFTDKILQFKPVVYVFEPFVEYYSYLQKKYKDNNNVIVCPYGLSNINTEKNLYILGEKSSYFGESGMKQKTKLVDVYDFFNENIPHKEVALVSINIEGGEYELIDRIIKAGLMRKIKVLQVQFHETSGGYRKKRSKLIKKILKTHKTKFSYPFVWDAFERR